MSIQTYFQIHRQDLEHALLPLARLSAHLTRQSQSDINILLFVQRLQEVHGGELVAEVWAKVQADVASRKTSPAVAVAGQFKPGTRLINDPSPDKYSTGK